MRLFTGLIVGLLMLPVSVAQADDVSLEEAQQKAQDFMLKRKGTAGVMRRAPLNLVSLETAARQTGLHSKAMEMVQDEAELPELYAFNMEGGGFVIVSGDDRTVPILGYSTTGTIDWQRIPENMKAWLREYSKAIRNLGYLQAKDGNVMGEYSQRTQRAAIKPLLTTKWNQSQPYNDECPIYNGPNTELVGQRSVTGCTCTATVQVMAYHKWPKSCGEIPGYQLKYYDANNENVSKEQTIEALPPTTFQWDQMLDEYTQENPGTAEQRKAVAVLMRYLGQAVEMHYTPEESGADLFKASDVLKKYFGYDQGLKFACRDGYGIDEWEGMIYKELEEKRPVIYSGGGHTFVCDGYDSNGLFSINWGWGGYCDNYFSLSVLNPNSKEGIGAGSDTSDYSIAQQAVFGVKPATEPQTYVHQDAIVNLYGDIAIIENGDGVHFQYIANCMTGHDVPSLAGLAYKDSEGRFQKAAVCTDKLNNTLINSAYIMNSDEGFNGITAETKLWPFVEIDGYEKLFILGTEYDFVYATPNDKGKLTFSKESQDLQIKYVDVREIQQNVVSPIVVKIFNNGPEYSSYLKLVPTYENDNQPTDGDMSYEGIYMRAGESGDVTFLFKPSKTGNAVLKIYTSDDILLGEFDVIVSEIQEDITGINSITNQKKTTTDKYYNLNGQQVMHPEKGVFITNGRKIVKK